MGKKNDGNYKLPIEKYRKDIGNFTRKIQLKTVKENQNK
jgi:hypothetical protein